jgi:hypothetical protein
MKSFLLFSLLSFTLMAEPTNLIKADQFEHINPGCPSNSKCNPINGDRYRKWKDFLGTLKFPPSPVLLNDFKTKNGIPLNNWVKASAAIRGEFILWDSSCRQHQKSKDFLQGIIFVKNLKELSQIVDDKNVPQSFWSPLIVMNPQTKATTIFSIPRDQTPQMISDTEVHFIHEEDGMYLGLNLKLNGEIEFSDIKKTSFFPSTVDCPKELVAAWNKEKYPANLFGTTLCKEVWNNSTKSLSVTMMPETCL